MKVDPVARYAKPRFPTHAILDAHPELLRLVPGRWRNNQVVLTVLASMCLAVTSCKAATSADTHAKAAQVPALSLVAPIFEHGAGHGSFGCDAVNPPVFLSEEEARQVIIEEGKRAGVSFSADSMILPNINVPVTSESSYPEDKKISKGQTKQQALQLDGTDVKQSISYEYVSQQDYRNWENPKEAMSRVPEFDVIGTARVLRDGLAQTKPQGAYAVFYDPMVGIYANYSPKIVSRFSDNTMAPLQALFYGKYTVKEINNETVFVNENLTVKFTEDSDMAIVNNTAVKLPCKVIKIYGSVYVPLRVVAELLHIAVQWNQKKPAVSLRFPGSTSEQWSLIVSKQYGATQNTIDIAFSQFDSNGRIAESVLGINAIMIIYLSAIISRILSLLGIFMCAKVGFLFRDIYWGVVLVLEQTCACPALIPSARPEAYWDAGSY